MDQVQSNFEMIPVKEMQLDFNNPRIARWIEMYSDDITAEQMALALGAGGIHDGEGGPTFSDLRQSILTNGRIIHPIIVNRESPSKHIVIEGNTRVLIYREFSERNIDGNWETIPSMVYEKMTDVMIDAIRLQSHLVGTREWDPYSKAKYLDCLRNKKHLTFSQLVDFCGGKKQEVQNYISAYQDMENFYRSLLDSDQDFDPTRFTAFMELQRSKVTNALLNTNFSKSDFAQWVIEKKLFPLSTIRSLPQILKHEKSRDVFLKKGAQEAMKILVIDTPEESLKDATLEQLAREVCKRVNELRYADIQRLRSIPDSEEKDIICEAKESLSELCSDISSESD